LRKKAKTDPFKKLPEQYYKFLGLFSKDEANKLLPLRGAGVDHAIKLEKVDRKEPTIP
jgi:hypothetical protein